MKKNYIVPVMKTADLDNDICQLTLSENTEADLTGPSESREQFSGDGSNSNGSSLWNEW